MAVRSPLRTSKLQVPTVLLSSSSWRRRRWSRPGWRWWAGSWWFPRLSCRGRHSRRWSQCHYMCHTLARSHVGSRTKLPRVSSISFWPLQATSTWPNLNSLPMNVAYHNHISPILYPWELSSLIWVVWCPICFPKNCQLIHAALPSEANTESVGERKVKCGLK